MADKQDDTQKFQIKLPPQLHRELMAYAGLKGEPLGEVLVAWISEVWEKKPERTAIIELTARIAGNSSTTPIKPRKSAPKHKEPRGER